MGKPEKDIPRIAGQHAPYLFQSIKMFQWRKRNHGKEDDDQVLFDDLKDGDIFDLTAHVATLDDQQYLAARKAADRQVAMAERKAQVRSAVPRPVPGTRPARAVRNQPAACRSPTSPRPSRRCSSRTA